MRGARHCGRRAAVQLKGARRPPATYSNKSAVWLPMQAMASFSEVVPHFIVATWLGSPSAAAAVG